MKKHGLTEQRLVTIGKQLIRSRIIQTQAVFAQGNGKPKRQWSVNGEQALHRKTKRLRSATTLSDNNNQLVGAFVELVILAFRS